MHYFGHPVTNETLSALFNAIMFARAVEDNHYRREQNGRQALLEMWNGGGMSLRELLVSAISRFTGEVPPDFLVDADKLAAFDEIDRGTTRDLLHSFYWNRRVPYTYDFSIMSKHALSRIYERYVVELQPVESQQMSLPYIPPLPVEEFNKQYGSIYTPHFIARFFAKYLREQLPPVLFKRLRTIDPACGSGIFLRTMLELQCDPVLNHLTPDLVEYAFNNTTGIDRDANATQATRLSLALLYLALTDQLPSNLEIHTEETVSFFEERAESLRGSYDVVVANPPFVSWDNMDPAMRDSVTGLLNHRATGRTDLYLAFLFIGMELLKPGAFGLFVLPHSFLINESAKGMREYITQNAWVRCLVDLSAIEVFGDSGIYPVLLILQKRTGIDHPAPPATVAKVQDLVGRALQDILDRRRVDRSTFYNVYDVDQGVFDKEQWSVVPPLQAAIQEKFTRLPRLEDFLFVRQGFISGSNDVFIVSEGQVPTGEEAMFVPYLPDRAMRAYVIPEDTDQYFFYPYVDGIQVEETTLREQFPQTWAYLNAHKSALSKRSGVRRGQLEWWRPDRPRLPRHMMRPKLVSPHLVLVPRFSADFDGRYAISRAPLLYPREQGSVGDMLKYFLGVLNSTPCYWHVATNSHTYRRGYVMLEPKTLKQTPVPDPTKIDRRLLRSLISLVEERLEKTGATARTVEKQIDQLVADLYGLNGEERVVISMES